MVFVEEYYKIMAWLLVAIYEKMRSWNEVANYYENNFKKAFDVLHPKILNLEEDSLFNEIEDAIGADYA